LIGGGSFFIPQVFETGLRPVLFHYIFGHTPNGYLITLLWSSSVLLFWSNKFGHLPPPLFKA
jgi:hypothetical protein